MSASVALKLKLAGKKVQKKRRSADPDKVTRVGLSATEPTTSVASTGTRSMDGDVFLDLPKYDQDACGKQVCGVVRFRIPVTLLKAEEFCDASISRLLRSSSRKWAYFTDDHRVAVFETQDEAECAAIRAGYDMDHFIVRQIHEDYLPTDVGE